MRKKNRILSCETVTRGYMIYVQTPNDQLHHRLYSGYSKRQALSMARHTDNDRQAGLPFGQPCKTLKERKKKTQEMRPTVGRISCRSMEVIFYQR